MFFDDGNLIIIQLPFSELNEKLPKSLIKKLVIFTHNIVFSTFFVRLETIDFSSNLKIMLNTTAVLFMKVIVCVVKNVGESVTNCYFEMG